MSAAVNNECSDSSEPLYLNSINLDATYKAFQLTTPHTSMLLFWFIPTVPVSPGEASVICIFLLPCYLKLLPALLSSYLNVQSSKRDRCSTDRLIMCNSSCNPRLLIRKCFSQPVQKYLSKLCVRLWTSCCVPFLMYRS